MSGTKGVTTRTAVNSHLCVMIGASVVLSQSQHLGVSHYLPVWLRPKLTPIKLGLLITACTLLIVIQTFHNHQIVGHEDLAGIMCSASKTCVHAHSPHAFRILFPNLG